MTDHAVRFGSGTIPTAAPTVAALDLGTNNRRLLIAAPTRHGFRVIDSFSRIVRLGEGLHGSGRLSDEAMDRAIGAPHTCANRIGRRRPRGRRAVATEACRRAGNGRAFLDRVRTETGLSIDVISTREEAELALERCAALLGADLPQRPSPDGDDADAADVRSRPVGRRDLRPVSAPRPAAGAADQARSRALLFDIGGGSTEIAWIRIGRENAASAKVDATQVDAAHPDGRDAVPELAGYQSLPLGVLTLSGLFGDQAFTASGYEAMVEHVTAQLHAFEAMHCIRRDARRRAVRLLGTSGTVTTLAGVALGLRRCKRVLVDGMVLSPEAAREAIALLRRLGPDGLRRHPRVGPERTASVLPGCAIFEAIQRSWPTDGVVVADRGLRDGMLLRMMRGRSATLVDRLPIPTRVSPVPVVRRRGEPDPVSPA